MFRVNFCPSSGAQDWGFFTTYGVVSCCCGRQGFGARQRGTTYTTYLEINKTVIVASRWFPYYLTYIDDAQSNTNRDIPSSGMLRDVDWWLFSDVSGQHLRPPIDCSETSVYKYQSTPSNSPDGRRSDNCAWLRFSRQRDWGSALKIFDDNFGNRSSSGTASQHRRRRRLQSVANNFQRP